MGPFYDQEARKKESEASTANKGRIEEKQREEGIGDGGGKVLVRQMRATDSP